MKHLYSSLFLAVCALSATAAQNVTVQNARPVTATLTPTPTTETYRAEVSTDINRMVISAAAVDACQAVSAPRAATLDGEEEVWNSLGMAQYTEDCMTTWFNVPNLTYEVEIQENAAVPGYYRLVNPYGEAYLYNDEGDWDTTQDYYMYIHAEDPSKVWIDYSPTGMDWGYGEVTIYSFAGYYIANGNEASAASYYGTLEEGSITFPAEALLASMAGYQNGAFFNANKNGKFNVLLPGSADYSIAVAAPACAAENKVPFSTTVGADVAQVGVCWLKGNFGINGDNASYIFENASTYGVQMVPGNKTYTISLSQPGFYTLFVMAVDGEGNYKGFDGTQIYCYDDNDEDWTSLGKGSYTEDFIASAFNGVAVQTLEVEIQENNTTPGYFRVVNPYENHSVVAGASTHNSDHPHHLYINASDPERVYVENTPMGVKINGNEYTFHCMALNYKQGGYTDAQIDNQGVWGTFDEETRSITFPTKALLFGIVGSSSLYYANSSGSFEVKVPATPSGISAVETDTNAPVEYFNLQGIRVDSDAKGLLIKRQGATVTKVVR